MSLERRLREQLDAAGEQLAEPGDRLERVVRRGRRRRVLQNTSLGLTALVVVLGAGAGWRAMTTTRVAFDPGATPSAVATASDPVTPLPTAEPTPASTATPSAAPSPAPTQRPAPPQHVALGDLEFDVLTYGGDASGLSIQTPEGRQALFDGRVEVALPDNQGGAVLQSGRSIVWVAAPEVDPVTLVELDRPLLLRAVLPQGRVIYSVPDTKRRENMVERYFIVDLAEGAEPELFVAEGSFEAWSIGPAALADGSLVMAGCHMVCSIGAWPSHDTVAPFPDPLYYGGGGEQGPGAAIEGLTSTPDGAFVGWVDYAPSPEVPPPPQLVVFDGAAFKQLARVILPVAATRQIGVATVSLSSDGQQVLVTIHPPYVAPGETSPERHVTYLIDRALTRPRLRIVDAPGVVQWLEPDAVGYRRR